jgi:hypothetical protein
MYHNAIREAPMVFSELPSLMAADKPNHALYYNIPYFFVGFPKRNALLISNGSPVL